MVSTGVVGFVNLGTLNTITPTADTHFTLPFSNSGTFNIGGNTVFLQDVSDNSGIINIASGINLTLDAGAVLILNSGSAFTGSLGNLNVPTGETLDVAVLQTLPVGMTLNLQGGTINNAQNLTTPGTFNITGGTINGIGTFNTPGLTTVNYTGANNLNVSVDWLSDSIFNFASAFGDMDIQSTFTFFNANQFNLSPTSASAQIIGLGIFNNSGSLILNAPVATVISSPFINSAGTVDIVAGSSFSLAGADLVLGGGRLTGEGLFVGNVVADSASTIAPGVGIGTIDVSGNVAFQSGSAFEIDLDSTTSDLLRVGGNISIDGATILVNSLGGYIGNLGDNFTVISTTTGTVTELSSFSVSDDPDFLVNPVINFGPPGDVTLNVAILNNFWVAGSGSWLNVSNWSRGIVPDVGHDVTINTGSAINVAYSTSASINKLTTSNLTTLDLSSGSLTINDNSVIVGALNLNASTLTLNGVTTIGSVSMTSASILGGTGTVDVVDTVLSGILAIDSSEVRDLANVTAIQYSVTGTSRFNNTVVNHDGVMEITGVTDRLILQGATQLISAAGSGTPSVTGDGTFELQAGSEWAVNFASLPMAVPLTLEVNGGGTLTNIENIIFPGTVNLNDVNINQNGVINIPSTTTFNYAHTQNIAPNFDINNDGIFNINTSSPAIDISGNSALFINNNELNILSQTDVNILSDVQNNGTMSTVINSSFIVNPSAILTLNGSVSGAGSLSVNGAMNVTALTTLPASLVLNLGPGGIISNAENMTVAGPFNWAGGAVNGTGPGFTTAGATTLQDAVLNAEWDLSAGTASILSGGVTNFQTGSLIINSVANFDINSGGTLNIVPGFSGISGAGPLNVLASSDLDLGGVATDLSALSTLNVAGTVSNVQLASLPQTVNVSNTGELKGDGALTVLSATTLNMNGGTLSGISSTNPLNIVNQGVIDVLSSQTLVPNFVNLDNIIGTISGAGTIDISLNSSLGITGSTASIARIILNGGQLSANSMSYAGNLEWNSGIVGGSGTGLTTSGQVDVLTGVLNTDWIMSAGTASVLSGGVTNFQTGSLTISSSAKLDINAGGTLNIVPGFSGISGAGPLNVQTSSNLDLGGVATDLSGLSTMDVAGTVTNVQLASLPQTVNVSSGGELKGDGALTILSASTLNMNGGTLSGISLTNPLNIINQGVIDVSSGQTLTPNFVNLDNIIGAISGAGEIDIPVNSSLGVTGSTASIARISLNGGQLSANSMSYAGNLEWNSGTVGGSGTGLTTTGQVDLQSGILDVDWTITSTGVVNWNGPDSNSLTVNSVSITNQGQFFVNGVTALVRGTLDDLAAKNLNGSAGAAFINEGLLLINGDPLDLGNEVVDFSLNFQNVNGGDIGIQSGTFAITDSDGIAQDLNLGAGSELQGLGTFQGNVINTAGIVTPGGDFNNDGIIETGALNITGDFNQGTAGILRINLDSTLAGLQSGQLGVGGQLTAGGTIDFNVVNGKSLAQIALLLNESFTPIQITGQRSGSFSSVNIPPALNFTLNADGSVSIASDVDVFNQVSQEIDELTDGLAFEEVKKVIKNVENKIEIFNVDEEEDEEEDERAPKLVCK